MLKSLLDWLDSRTSYRALLHHALDEPVPKGTSWPFTTGSVLMFLLGTQIATGVVLTMYYVPSPSLAYDSVRYITDTLTFGWMLRGLHFWGASFIVVAAAIHLLRVFLYGSYKAPREVNWIIGVVLLLIILAFSLSGYLLPWDQKAYWATTVTINIARSSPLIGEYLADVLRGGSELGALTLGRWYSAHVFLLPLALVTFVVGHIALLRKHGISGPITPQVGPPDTFYPWHVMKDTVMMAAVFALLLTVVWLFPAHLDEIANPADAAYVPRPEWYFLSLFQMLKYFPGPLEPVATMVIPGVVIGFLFLLPFLDRGPDRRPFGGARRVLTFGMAVIALGVTVLTTLGLRDMPVRADLNEWGPRAIAGHTLVMGEQSKCATCHVTGGPAADLGMTRITKDDEWLLSHMSDPVALAPGVRPPNDPAPPPQVSRFQAQAIVAYLRRVRAGAREPIVDEQDRTASVTVASACIGCHKINGDGGEVGPDLTHVGSRRTREDIRSLVTDPTLVYGDTIMPAYGERLTPGQLDAVAQYLAKHQ
jgi:ubiquinol-cytochrome c reductase cytochrome b subunit